MMRPRGATAAVQSGPSAIRKSSSTLGIVPLTQTTRLSKTILQAYYGKAAGRAYFSGCSDGGREALMEAERYPEDFDGIIAGAPANHWTHHFAGFLWNEIALNGKPEGKLPQEKLPAIEKAALAECDARDGVKDGLIQDPRRCQFDPSCPVVQGNRECGMPDRAPDRHAEEDL